MVELGNIPVQYNYSEYEINDIKVSELAEQLTALAHEFPDATLRLNVSAEGGCYECSYHVDANATLTVAYFRPPTETEIQAIKDECARIEKMQKEREENIKAARKKTREIRKAADIAAAKRLIKTNRKIVEELLDK